MKILGFIFFILISNAKADVYHLSCVSSDLKSAIDIRSLNDKMIFSYTNKEGKKYFPLYSGVVTAKIIPYLKSVRNAVSDIGSKVEFSMPLDQCSVGHQQPYLIKCSNAFSTSLSTEQTFSFSYEKVNVKFTLVVDNKNYEISIPFSKERCFVIYENI